MAGQKINLTVLFADVSDSTRLYESIGDTAAFGNVREVIGLLKGITDSFGGRVVALDRDGNLVREILGFGTVFGMTLFEGWTNWVFMIVPGGAFIVVAIYIGIVRYYSPGGTSTET